MKYIIKLFISVIFILAHTVSVSAQSTKGGIYTLVTSTDQIVNGGIYLIAGYVKTSKTEEYTTYIMTTRKIEGAGFYVCNYSNIYNTYNNLLNEIDLRNEIINSKSISSSNITTPYEYTISISGTKNEKYSFMDAHGSYLSADNTSLILSNTETYWNIFKEPNETTNFEFVFANKPKDTSYYLKYTQDNTFNTNKSYNVRGAGTTPYINLYKKAETTQITISQAKYSTLYYENNDVYLPEGLEGFTILQSEGKLKKGTKYGSTNVIPAGTAVVLYGEPGNYDISLLPHNEENISPSNNLLRGNETEQAVIEENDLEKYVLSYNGDISTIGFYRIGTYDGITCPAHKAYLSLPKEMTSKAILFSELNETTGIDIIKRETSNTHESEALFDISGRKVNKMSKGLYIKNKKKIFIK